VNNKIDAWQAPPDDVRIGGNEVHVWLGRLDDAGFCLSCGEQLLSSEEKERAVKFKFERDRRRYIVSHAGLRSVLSNYLHIVPGDLTFSAGPSGKPFLAPIGGKALGEFNLSHSNEVALIAVAREKEIGVDVEWIARDIPFREIAGRFFSAREVAAMNALPDYLQRLAFFKCWTSKEAFLKAKGTGLSGKLDEVEIVSVGGEGVAIKAVVPRWTLAELNPDDGYTGAVVFESGECKIQCYRWAGLTAICPHQNS
jgi:4'-phosphopantetheinyl transferase